MACAQAEKAMKRTNSGAGGAQKFAIFLHKKTPLVTFAQCPLDQCCIPQKGYRNGVLGRHKRFVFWYN
jgi:hypothetical protein